MKDITEIFFRDVSTNIQLLVCNQFKIIMQTQYDPLRFYSKSELARLAGVSSRTFRRYLATRRAIFTAMGISPFARKLPPQAVRYISEDYCIDVPVEET